MVYTKQLLGIFCLVSVASMQAMQEDPAIPNIRDTYIKSRTSIPILLFKEGLAQTEWHFGRHDSGEIVAIEVGLGGYHYGRTDRMVMRYNPVTDELHGPAIFLGNKAVLKQAMRLKSRQNNT